MRGPEASSQHNQNPRKLCHLQSHNTSFNKRKFCNVHKVCHNDNSYNQTCMKMMKWVVFISLLKI